MTFSELDNAYRQAKKAPFWDRPTKILFAVFAIILLPLLLLTLPFLL